MEDNKQSVRETTVESGDSVDTTTEVSSESSSTQHTINVLERIVWFIGGIIEALLATRFVLALLGANSDNMFADFIYRTSHMFVSPFFSLFNYQEYINGVSRFEGYTVVAMLVYLLITTGIAKLVTLNSR